MRLGDEIDDFCTKCKRLTNHFILAMVGQDVARVRCRTCYNEQEFRNGAPLPPRPRSSRKQAAPTSTGEDAASAGEPAAPDPSSKSKSN